MVAGDMVAIGSRPYLIIEIIVQIMVAAEIWSPTIIYPIKST